jgi:hypothetical protein
MIEAVRACPRWLVVLAAVAAVLLGGIDGCVFGCGQDRAAGSRRGASAHCHGDAKSTAPLAWQSTAVCSHQHDASLSEATPAGRLTSPLHPVALAVIDGTAAQNPPPLVLAIADRQPDPRPSSLVSAFSVPLRL